MAYQRNRKIKGALLAIVKKYGVGATTYGQLEYVLKQKYSMVFAPKVSKNNWIVTPHCGIELIQNKIKETKISYEDTVHNAWVQALKLALISVYEFDKTNARSIVLSPATN